MTAMNNLPPIQDGPGQGGYGPPRPYGQPPNSQNGQAGPGAPNGQASPVGAGPYGPPGPPPANASPYAPAPPGPPPGAYGPPPNGHAAPHPMHTGQDPRPTYAPGAYYGPQHPAPAPAGAAVRPMAPYPPADAYAYGPPHGHYPPPAMYQHSPYVAVPGGPQAAPRQRTSIACRYCRKRKIRCTGIDRGRCFQCTRTNQECVFQPVSTGSGSAAFVHVSALAGGPPPGMPTYGAFGEPLPGTPAGPPPPTHASDYPPPPNPQVLPQGAYYPPPPPPPGAAIGVPHDGFAPNGNVPNGRAGSQANGHTNGHVNGHTNGPANGRANGHTNGRTNGYVNGHALPYHHRPRPSDDDAFPPVAPPTQQQHQPSVAYSDESRLSPRADSDGSGSPRVYYAPHAAGPYDTPSPPRSGEPRSHAVMRVGNIVGPSVPRDANGAQYPYGGNANGAVNGRGSGPVDASSNGAHYPNGYTNGAATNGASTNGVDTRGPENSIDNGMLGRLNRRN